MAWPRSYGLAASASALAGTLAISAPALATEDEHWDYLPGMTSGQLADKGKKLISSSGLSWPDGSQAIVTFWLEKRGVYVRCTTYFDKSMAYNGDKCERGKKPKTAKPKTTKNNRATLPERKPREESKQ